jgi:hypothetical protein
MIRRLVERLKKLKGRQAEEPEYASEPDCADCPDYDDCVNSLICIATAED